MFSKYESGRWLVIGFYKLHYGKRMERAIHDGCTFQEWIEDNHRFSWFPNGINNKQLFLNFPN